MVTQLRDRAKDFEERNARVVCIGLDAVEETARFKSARGVPFMLLSDPRRTTYKALEMNRGSILDLVGPRVWRGALRSLLSGNIQGAIRGNPYQLGGTMVVAPGGEVLSVHRSKNSADNPSVDELLAALGQPKM